MRLKECLDSGLVPSCLARERTPLLQKDKRKCNVANNYRPLTCFPIMWKLLTDAIVDQIYAQGAGKVLEELMIHFILIGQ